MQAQVLYEYEAQDGDQLTIKPGEIIEILDDSADLNGWALAKKGEKEGYVPAEYVRFIDQHVEQPDSWKPGGFDHYYQHCLLSEHKMSFSLKLIGAFRNVFIPFPCSRFQYTMSRNDLKRGAILHLLLSFIVSLVDLFSIISPCIIFNNNDSPTIGQILLTIFNTIIRIILCLIHIYKYPRPDLILTTLPFLNVLSSLTYSIRIYELLEMGDNKEYDGYRYYRSWMIASLCNIPFCIIGLILITLNAPGLIAISILVLVWNLLNVGRCFLAQWACKESGNDIHPDFESVIKNYQL
jgi:hypothetical protein